MDTAPVAPRVLALVRTIRQVVPDVICLQELTRDSYRIITNALCQPLPAPSTTPAASEGSGSDSGNDSDTTKGKKKRYHYTAHCGSEWSETLPYFSAMFTRHDLFLTDDTYSSDSVQFPPTKSVMFRGYVHVSGTLRNTSGARTPQKVSLITSHLESLKDGAVNRKLQLKDILDVQREKANDNFVTIFTGDTNLRENEVPAREIEKQKVKIDGESKKKRARTNPKFQDAWVLNGCNDQHKFTWDMAKNDNLDFQELTFKPKARYDRAFLMPPIQASQFQFPLSVPKFQLLGTKRLDCEKFLSDHWGLLFEVAWSCET